MGCARSRVDFLFHGFPVVMVHLAMYDTYLLDQDRLDKCVPVAQTRSRFANAGAWQCRPASGLIGYSCGVLPVIDVLGESIGVALAYFGFEIGLGDPPYPQ
jgi:hypothetical protein